MKVPGFIRTPTPPSRLKTLDTISEDTLQLTKISANCSGCSRNTVPISHDPCCGKLPGDTTPTKQPSTLVHAASHLHATPINSLVHWTRLWWDHFPDPSWVPSLHWIDICLILFREKNHAIGKKWRHSCSMQLYYLGEHLKWYWVKHIHTQLVK